MGDELRVERFAERCGDQFTLTHEQLEGSLQLELVRVERLPSPGSDVAGVRAEPFSLDFAGPLEPVLPQAMFTLSHPDLGETQLFLIPRGPVDGKQRYQVVIN